MAGERANERAALNFVYQVSDNYAAGSRRAFVQGFRRFSRPGGRRKDLARNRRSLQQLGNVEYETHAFGAQFDRALAAYLEIEASGASLEEMSQADSSLIPPPIAAEWLRPW